MPGAEPFYISLLLFAIRAFTFGSGSYSLAFVIVIVFSIWQMPFGTYVLKKPSRGNGTVLLIVPFKINSLLKLPWPMPKQQYAVCKLYLFKKTGG
jgi:hypothetical protein